MLKFGCRQVEGLLHADKDPMLHPHLRPHLNLSPYYNKGQGSTPKSKDLNAKANLL